MEVRIADEAVGEIHMRTQGRSCSLEYHYPFLRASGNISARRTSMTASASRDRGIGSPSNGSILWILGSGSSFGS
ncbi:hypothetical protein L6164_036701 [Bauhinia variegata]|uniref:Uncharacterized protein n=1 Tax=Bauhinia variegata TaxID=167791 RepID=A0ACB9KHW9_BAUVA|nr:hypothetical protein L6164_036701 [Bauhinia variegata]